MPKKSSKEQILTIVHGIEREGFEYWAENFLITDGTTDIDRAMLDYLRYKNKFDVLLEEYMEQYDIEWE